MLLLLTFYFYVAVVTVSVDFLSYVADFSSVFCFVRFFICDRFLLLCVIYY